MKKMRLVVNKMNKLLRWIVSYILSLGTFLAMILVIYESGLGERAIFWYVWILSVLMSIVIANKIAE